MNWQRVPRQLLVLLMASVVVGSLSGCGYTKLVVENENVVAWMTVSNEFAQDDSEHRDRWRGVLMHIGTYPNTKYFFKGVQFYDGDEVIYELDDDDFHWINIVGGGDLDEPMGEEHASLLFPSQNPDPCETVFDAVKRDDIDFEALGYADYELCFRERTFHNKHDPKAMLTYWTGEKGYEFTDYQELGPLGDESNLQTFHFRDRVTIGVFQEVLDGDTYVMKQIETPDLSEVTAIHIVSSLGPPADGSKIDPSWGGP